jgi:hypothetical protein
MGKRPGLHQPQIHPVVQGCEERRAAAHQDRMGDDHVLVDQPGPHGRRGECGTADVHGAAVVGLEPGDLGDRVAGDQACIPVDHAGRRREHHLRHVPPAAGVLDLRRCGTRLLVCGRPVGAHRLPQFAPVQRQTRRPHPVGPPLEQLIARYAPAEVVAGRGDVAVPKVRLRMVSVSRGSIFVVQTSTARRSHRSGPTEGQLITTPSKCSVRKGSAYGTVQWRPIELTHAFRDVVADQHAVFPFWPVTNAVHPELCRQVHSLASSRRPNR